MYIHDWLREHLLTQVGVITPTRKPPLQVLAQTEWCCRFEQLMRNRLILGALRYGTMQENLERNRQYNRVQSIYDRLDRYKNTGNLEHLVDIANLCMLEFLFSTHPTKHFSSSDDGPHTAEVDVKAYCESSATPAGNDESS